MANHWGRRAFQQRGALLQESPCVPLLASAFHLPVATVSVRAFDREHDKVEQIKNPVA